MLQTPVCIAAATLFLIMPTIEARAQSGPDAETVVNAL